MTDRQKSEVARRLRLDLPHPRFSGMSFLENVKVSPELARDYQRRLTQFLAWCQARGESWATDKGLDSVRVLLFDEMFFKGKPMEDGSKILAALRFCLHPLKKGGPAALPRASRALAGWRRRAPPAQRPRCPS